MTPAELKKSMGKEKSQFDVSGENIKKEKRLDQLKSKRDKLLEKAEYIELVHKRIEDFSAAYIIDAEGNKKYPKGYSRENDLDRQKLIYFFRCVNYDKEIVELILNPNTNSIRTAILEAPLYDLIIRSVNGG